MHTSVFQDEAIEALKVEAGKKYIDATIGEAGHLKKILEKGGNVLGIDWDERQVEKAKETFKDNSDVTIVAGNFADVGRLAGESGFAPAQGILFDLGLSYAQIKEGGRGLSYQAPDEALDMRLSSASELTAEEIVNTWTEEELYAVFSKNSEDMNSQKIATEIYRTRKDNRIKKVADLTNLIDRVVGTQDRQTYARIFQALRMEVNQEKENLEKGLDGAVELLSPEGRGVIITFHSLEDRIVKLFIRKSTQIREIKKEKKVKRELFAFERSARLRIFEKL